MSKRAGMLLVALVAGALAFPSIALAESKRCPDDSLAATGADALPGEITAIEQLWRDIHGPGLSGGDGPLGCAVGVMQKVDSNQQTWKGVQQRFQRGWILIGRGASAGSEIAMIRGLGTWTIWYTGLPSKVLPTVEGVGTGDFKTAKWFRGGRVFVMKTSNDIVSLLRCTNDEGYSKDTSIAGHACEQLTPPLDTPDRPFEFAARLDKEMLAVPGVDGVKKRVDALFPDWLPCHTDAPTIGEYGESPFARAMIMMRRDAACPITGESPSGVVKAWLIFFGVPADMFPGTTSTNTDCPRNGDFDVTLVQIMKLILQYRAALTGPVLDHLKQVVNGSGVTARKNPYVQPEGLCYGFGLIESENHLLLQESASYLINDLMGRDTAGNRDWLIKFMSQIARRDFYEFNAIPYSRYDLKGLYVLHDYAPDEQVRIAAKGLLDWVFAKEAVSGNLDRDHRPFRRAYHEEHLVPWDWWSSAATPVTTQAALFAGPLQHAHSDIDLQFDDGRDEQGKLAFTEVTLYPKLGAAPSYLTEALVDAANSGYRLPDALAGWLERRFTTEESNRSTYVQAINHVPKIGEDPAIFVQAGSGAELVSGNRNWTMIGGGTPAPPGDPGPPPETTGSEGGYIIAGVAAGAVAGAYIGSTLGPIGTAAGAIIGAIVGGIVGSKAPKEIAADKQNAALWDTQAGTIRETTLIPTPVGLDRSQTIRFGRTTVTTGNPQVARLCVAEGFMCGYDLRMPTRAFPAADALTCPVAAAIPTTLATKFQTLVGPGQTMTTVLGCAMKTPGFLDDGSWTIWTFENGMLAMALGDPAGQERFASAWIEGRTKDDRGRLRVVWNIQGDGYDWFRVHAYAKSVAATGGEPPGGWIEPLPVVGDAGDRTKGTDGDTSIPIPQTLDPDYAAPSWDVLIVGCTKKYFIGVLRGHACFDNKMPRLTVDVGPLPKQSFACAVPPPPPPNLTLQAPRHEGIVMEVGSCKHGPYGFFTYVWSHPCPPTNATVSQGSARLCPEGAIDYGFVVAAPSRGLEANQFRQIVESSMVAFRAGKQDYAPGVGAAIAVPLSPPVQLGATGWTPTGTPGQHVISFRWPVVDGASILADTGALGVFGPAALGADPKSWPTALGHVTAPDVAGASTALMRNAGAGCFTVAGYPTPSDPDPTGLFVDFRNLAAVVVADRATSQLVGLCP